MQSKALFVLAVMMLGSCSMGVNPKLEQKHTDDMRAAIAAPLVLLNPITWGYELACEAGDPHRSPEDDPGHYKKWAKQRKLLNEQSQKKPAQLPVPEAGDEEQ